MAQCSDHLGPQPPKKDEELSVVTAARVDVFRLSFWMTLVANEVPRVGLLLAPVAEYFARYKIPWLRVKDQMRRQLTVWGNGDTWGMLRARDECI